VVDPENRIMQVYRPDGSSVRLREDDEVSGEDVVPGFRCRVGEFFPAPVEVAPSEATNPVS
jgi:hypothetical protein